MFSTVPGMPLIVSILLVLAALGASGAAFGFMPVLLFMAMAASAAIFCGFLGVAMSRDGH